MKSARSSALPRCVPALDQLDGLPTRLNDGERRVLDALLGLDRDWSIFVQPRLALIQPDFVAVHPLHGVWAIEVKNWGPDLYRATAGGMEVRTRQGAVAIDSPIAQAKRYRSVLFDRCFARPDETLDAKGRVRALVVLPCFSDAAAAALLGSSDYVKTVGGETLARLPAVLEEPADLAAPDPECLQRLYRSLGEPEFTSDQRLPLRLSVGARNVASNPNHAKIRRARGPAGCGKSIGIAARAVALAQQGKSVLVVSFNITLTHYLQDLCARDARSRGVPGWKSLISFSHFHGLCRDLLETSPNPKKWRADEGVDWLIEAVTELYVGGCVTLPTFDAILVDEGQDFELPWWTLLRTHLLRPGGEMLLVCDRSQNLYSRSNWAEESMTGGFSGPWTELKGTYRMPADLVPVVAEFAECHMSGSELDLPTVEPDHPAKGVACAPTQRFWRNVGENAAAWGVRLAVETLLEQCDGLHPSDIVVLADHGVGADVMEALRGRGHEVSHLFAGANGPSADILKKRFWAGSPGIKGSTFHSFKGWEARAVVAVLTHQTKAASLLYVAMTRVKADPYHRPAGIAVVNAVGALNDFQAHFTREITVQEVPALGGQQALPF